MILVDTSVWIDHLRARDPGLESLLAERRVLSHSLVIGEIACGSIGQRRLTLSVLDDLPRAIEASFEEVRGAMERRAWFGRGIGFIDACLLASALLNAPATLWSRDRRLRALAEEAGIAHTTGTLH